VSAPIRVVVGLGNPGPKYVGTRHNIGRDFIDYLAAEHQQKFIERPQAEFFRLGTFFDQELPSPVTFARLDTFMNTSGPAIQSLCSREGVKIAEVLVVVDEFMIPFGALRLRPDGSAGGHNGLKSIIETFGAQNFPRLRVGVGPVPPAIDPADFVLARFPAAERARMGDLQKAMADSLKMIFSDSFERAMNAVNKVHISL
jgi:PTH1 family peptidyl-tRNA hydrolase